MGVAVGGNGGQSLGGDGFNGEGDDGGDEVLGGGGQGSGLQAIAGAKHGADDQTDQDGQEYLWHGFLLS